MDTAFNSWVDLATCEPGKYLLLLSLPQSFLKPPVTRVKDAVAYAMITITAGDIVERMVKAKFEKVEAGKDYDAIDPPEKEYEVRPMNYR